MRTHETQEDTNEKPATKMTLECKYGTYSISIPKDDLDIHTLAEELIEPLLKCAGYSDQLIGRYFNLEG